MLNFFINGLIAIQINNQNDVMATVRTEIVDIFTGYRRNHYNIKLSNSKRLILIEFIRYLSL